MPNPIEVGAPPKEELRRRLLSPMARAPERSRHLVWCGNRSVLEAGGDAIQQAPVNLDGDTSERTGAATGPVRFTDE